MACSSRCLSAWVEGLCGSHYFIIISLLCLSFETDSLPSPGWPPAFYPPASVVVGTLAMDHHTGFNMSLHELKACSIFVAPTFLP